MAAVSSNKVSVKWSLFYVVVSIILTYVYQFLNLDPTSSIKYISYIPYIAFMFLAQKEYKEELGGFMTFGEGFLTGFKYTVITAVLMALFTYIYFTLLSPQVFQQIIDASKAKMEAKGNLSDDQINTALSFTTPGFTAIIIVIVSIIMGAIISLIGAAIFKKDKPPFFAQDPANYTDPAV
ncbi:MAG: DUF4199 domain-containing protein [Mucilaginibacter sp.]